MRVANFKAVPKNAPAAIVALAHWVKRYQPKLYAQIVKENPGLLDPKQAVVSLSGIYGDSVTPTERKSALRDELRRTSLLGSLGAADAAPDVAPSTDWGTSLANFGSGIITAINQQKLFNAQVARAEAGLPPLNVDAVGVPVNVGLSADSAGLVRMGMVGIAAYLGFKLLRGSFR